MKILTGVAAVAFVGAVGWRIGGSLSTDALGMAIGILFGIMAGIPATLVLLAPERRETAHRASHEQPQRPQIETRPAQQPPAQIVNNYHNHVHYHAAPSPQRQRRQEVEQRHLLHGPTPQTPAPRAFRIVGADETVDH